MSANIYHPSRGGVRGGRDQFNWDDVKDDKDRENYLGHSVKAPVGRWQKGKDLIWYTRDKAGSESAEERKRKELESIKGLEAQAMAAALGYKVPQMPVQKVDNREEDNDLANQIREQKKKNKRKKEKSKKKKKKQKRSYESSDSDDDSHDHRAGKSKKFDESRDDDSDQRYAKFKRKRSNGNDMDKYGRSNSDDSDNDDYRRSTNREKDGRRTHKKRHRDSRR